MTGSTNMVSGGRNPNCELTCDFPRCGWLQRATDRDGGWCANDANRCKAVPGWPIGFMPSVASTGGCDLHTSNIPICVKPTSERTNEKHPQA